MGSRPKVIFCVHGTRKCRMQDMFIVHYNGEQNISGMANMPQILYTSWPFEFLAF